MPERSENDSTTAPRRAAIHGLAPRITTYAHLETASGNDGAQPLTAPLAGDLVVAYVTDTSEGRRLVARDDLSELGIAADELLDRALANLTDDLSEIQLGEHSHLMMVQTGGELEACTLLLEGLWDQLTAQMEGEVAVGVPSADMVLIGDTASPAALDELRRAVPKLHNPEASNALSPQLFVWRDRRWCQLEPA
jgi:uncharacterized protein YtpQ (UPF0354 family)